MSVLAKMRDRAFYWHQPLTQILVNTRFYRSSHSKFVEAHFQADARGLSDWRGEAFILQQPFECVRGQEIQ